MHDWRFLWIPLFCLTVWTPKLLAEPTPIAQSQTLSGKYQFENGSAGLEFNRDRTVIIYSPSGDRLKLSYELLQTASGQKLRLISPDAPAKAPDEINLEIQPTGLIFKTGQERAVLRKVRSFSLTRSAPMNARSRVPEGKQLLGLINRAQQTYQARTNQFTDNLQQLGLNLNLEKSTYQYSSVLIDRTGIMTIAMPKTNGQKAYVGIVYLSYFKEMKQDIAIAVMCETNTNISPLAKFSPVPPPRPDNAEEGIICPVGTRQI
jgi:hypothetical protein